MISLLRTGMSRLSCCLYLLIVPTLCGCAGTKERDVLESRLRHQEDMLSSYQAQLDRVKTELDIARRESASLRQQLADAGTGLAPTEHLDASFRATKIEFSPFMTGGTNINSSPGDDGLTVVLLPKDPDGAVVKVAGQIEIAAFDLARPEGAQRIGYWTYSPSECHEFWHQGVIQSGYQFELPWQEIPTADKILLHGRLVAIDGRQFDTTHTMTIVPPDASSNTETQAAGTQTSPITQLSAFDDASSSIRQAHAESTSTPIGELKDSASPTTTLPKIFDPTAVIGPNRFGHSAAPRPQQRDAKAMTGIEFKEQLDIASPLTVGASTVPRRSVSVTPLPKDASRPVPFSDLPTSVSAAAPSDHGPAPFPDDMSELPKLAREIPPAIQDVPDESDDWWDNDDWPHETQRPATQTSDSWTDETIPYLR